MTLNNFGVYNKVFQLYQENVKINFNKTLYS